MARAFFYICSRYAHTVLFHGSYPYGTVLLLEGRQDVQNQAKPHYNGPADIYSASNPKNILGYFAKRFFYVADILPAQ